jgi:hypothetical protein
MTIAKRKPQPNPTLRCVLALRSSRESILVKGGGSGGGPAMGLPQCGQAAALSLTLMRHSGQSMRATGSKLLLSTRLFNLNARSVIRNPYC